MRRARLIAAVVVLCLPLAPAGVAVAQDEQDEGRVFPDDYRIPNKGVAGLNNVLTAPADPVMFAIEGDEIFEGAWQPQVTGRMLGFVAGVLQMPYRIMMGGFDLATSPLAPVMPMVSPAPRFKLIPHYHWDE